MEISKEQFFLSASQLGMEEDQINTLWQTLEKNQDSLSYAFSKWLYYFGALIIISAMTWMMTLSTELFGGAALFLISIIYGALFIFLGSKLWKKQGIKTPAGLLITAAVCMVPLAIYGLEVYLDLWPKQEEGNYQNYFSYIHKNYVLMEIGTIIAGLVALRFFSFPFLTFPIFFSAWFLSMDILPFFFGKEILWSHREWVSLFFGTVVLMISYLIQRYKKMDYAFWGYLFGTLLFWGSLTSLNFTLGQKWDMQKSVFFIYFMINIVLMFLSILLRVKVLMVVGVLGVYVYFSYLSYTVFENSVLFPFVMSFIGLSIVYLGILYQKNGDKIERKIRAFFPDWLNTHFE